MIFLSWVFSCKWDIWNWKVYNYLECVRQSPRSPRNIQKNIPGAPGGGPRQSTVSFLGGRCGPRPLMVTSVNFVLWEENLLLSSAHSLEESWNWNIFRLEALKIFLSVAKYFPQLFWYARTRREKVVHRSLRKTI